MKIYEQKEMIGCLKSFKSPMFDQIADEIERLQKAWQSTHNQLVKNGSDHQTAMNELSIKYSDLALKNEKLENMHGLLSHQYNELLLSDWVSVEDRLPDAYEEVFVFPRPDLNGIKFTAQYDKAEDEWLIHYDTGFGSDRFSPSVTHWREMHSDPIEE